MSGTNNDPFQSDSKPNWREYERELARLHVPVGLPVFA